MDIPILRKEWLMDADSVQGKPIIILQKGIKISVEYVSADHLHTHIAVFETSVASVEAEKHLPLSVHPTTIIAILWSLLLRSLPLRRSY
jgi:hypothetical protein